MLITPVYTRLTLIDGKVDLEDVLIATWCRFAPRRISVTVPTYKQVVELAALGCAHVQQPDDW